MDSREYWERKIVEWEDSQRGGSQVSLVERLAARFRGPLEMRQQLARQLLAERIEGARILDLGCGSGYFAFELFAGGAPSHVHGIDISAAAVARARVLARERALEERTSFSEGDVVALELPESDVVTGLGFLDYLGLEEIEALFARLQGRSFLFTFPERVLSLWRLLHVLYMRSQRCPKHYYFREAEIRRCVGDGHGTLTFFRDRRLPFGCIVHNLR